MNILGSTYAPIMDALKRKVGAHVTLRSFDAGLPVSAQLADVTVMVLGHQQVTASDIAQAPALRLIQQHGRGIDGVDLKAASAAKIWVANVPQGNSVAVAEHSLALIFYLAKQFHKIPMAISSRLTGMPAGLEVGGKTLGIIGLGAAGTELARRATALGMRVLAIRQTPARGGQEIASFVGGPKDIDHVLAQSDFVVLLATLTDGTRNMIGPREFALMKPSAYLINVARGGLVDRNALIDALKSGRIAGAGFDVFWSEPADPKDPLLALPNFVLSPHVAGFSDVSVDHVTDVMVANFMRLAQGLPLLNVVAGPDG